MKYFYGYKFLQNQKKEKVIKKIAFISGFLLVFQMSLGSLFFNVPLLRADNPPRIDTAKQAVSSICETAEITLTITGAGQPSESRKPIDVIFVIDRSGSMIGQYLDNVKIAVSNFIDEMNDPDQVAIVSYAGFTSDLSQINYGLGLDYAAAKSVLNDDTNPNFIEAGGGTCIECGLATAFGMLGSTDREQFVILLSDGVANVNGSNNICDGGNCPVASSTECITNAIAQGNNIKNLGAPIYSIGYRLEDISGTVYPQCNNGGVTEELARDTLKNISSGEADYYFNGDPDDINDVFETIAYEINDIAGYDVKIVEVLPVGLTYAGMISGQNPTTISGQEIIWEFGDMDIGDTREVKFLATTSPAGYNGPADDPNTRVEYFDYEDILRTVPFDIPSISIPSCSVQETGSITIVKDSNPDDYRTFYFNGDLGSFDLTDDGTNPTANTTFANQAVGEYIVTETEEDGWNLTSITCTGDDNQNSIVYLASSSIMIGLDADEDIVCTFLNIKQQPLPATSSISGYKFEDLDRDASTTKIVDEEWLISLFNVSASTTATTTTNLYGYYIFENLVEGIYEISEYLFGDWIQLLAPDPVDLENDDSTDNNFINYLPFCGNSIVDSELGEECDDGPNGSDTCTSNCTIIEEEDEDPYCGDGTVNQTSEECDGSDGVPSGYTCDSNCKLQGGGGGGGGSTPLSLRNEQVVCVSETEVTVTWLTNKYATGHVVYGTESQISIGASPNYGYTFSTETSADKLMSHSVNIAGLENNIYYFRPIANISSDIFGDEIAFNMADCKVIVLGDEGAPVLTIAKTVSKEKANPGETDIEFVITVKNEGNLTAFNVKLNDILPSGISFQDFDGNIKDWDLGDINSGEEVIIKYMAGVDANAAAKVYANNASASADNHATVNASAGFEVERVIVLAETGFKLSEFITLFISLLTSAGSAMFIRSRQVV